jgi:hypothetical protein
MHPTVAYDLARLRVADFHAEADADRRARAARRHDAGDGVTGGRSTLLSATRWRTGNDPTGLVRRLLARLRPAVAP